MEGGREVHFVIYIYMDHLLLQEKDILMYKMKVKEVSSKVSNILEHLEMKWRIREELIDILNCT
jgi:hypothetical protein